MLETPNGSISEVKGCGFSQNIRTTAQLADTGIELIDTVRHSANDKPNTIAGTAEATGT